MHSYKDLEAPVRHNQMLLSVLLLAALERHGGCIEHRLGHDVNAWAFVPSVRTGAHPLHVVRDRHVLLIEDTWTSGGNAQSAALTLKAGGAASVTIVALARWLKLEESPTSAFARSRLTQDDDPLACPVNDPACSR